MNPKAYAQNEKEIRRCGHILGDDVSNCLTILMFPSSNTISGKRSPI